MNFTRDDPERGKIGIRRCILLYIVVLILFPLGKWKSYIYFEIYKIYFYQSFLIKTIEDLTIRKRNKVLPCWKKERVVSRPHKKFKPSVKHAREN